MQPPIDLSKLSHAQKDELIVQLFEQVATLTQQVKLLTQRTQELEGRAAKNSRNSSKPPSSDGYGKPKPKSRRGKSGKRSGGQPGHKGRTLKQVAQADHVVDHVVSNCAGCGSDLSSQAIDDTECRQVFDIPPVQVQVTEHRAQIKTCPCCQHRNRALFPANVCQPVQYGTELQAMATYMSQYQLLPMHRLQEFFQDLYQLPLSQGTLDTILSRAYVNLEEFDTNALQQLKSSDLVHFDESGMRVCGTLHWLHVASTESVTCYHIDPKRGVPAMQAMGILDGFEGYAVHDHWASYYGYDRCYHVLCNAHHLRELIHACEQHDQQWAQKMITCLLEAKAEVDAAVAAAKSELSPLRVNYFENRYSRILRQGRKELPTVEPPQHKKRGRVKQHKVKNLHDRLVFHKYETLAFVDDFTVPFDNNLAERDVRMAKTKQKISGCFRSERGAQRFCRLRGFISTARKQGHSIIDSLRDAFHGMPFDPKPTP